VWVEIGNKPAMTDAGADLLEQIGICGSLSEAARRLRFSYRRAWMLLDAMNKRWPGPLVKTATGGSGGGGATVTELG
jgi:molybdate transport system regulatory protein